MEKLLENKKDYPHPTSFDFDPKPWRALLNTEKAGVREKGVARIALAVGENFDAVRSGSNKTLINLPADRGLRIGAYIAHLNSAAVEVTARGRLLGAPDKNPFTTALHDRIEDISPNASLTSDEALSGLVDSARFTLFELLHREDSEFSGNGEDLKESINYHLLAGQHYHVWHDIWQDVLYRGLFLNEDGHLQYDRKDLVHSAIVADYRIRRKLFSMAIDVDDEWGRIPLEYKTRYSDFDIKINADGCVRFKKSRRVPDRPPFQFVMSIAAEIELSASVLRTTLPKYGNVEISEMIECWRAISVAISGKIAEQVARIESELRLGNDWSIAPSDVLFCFNRLDLISDLSRVTEISRGKIAHIINAMKLNERSVSSLWAHPLVEISGDRLLAINIPFVSGTYLYPIRSWISEGGGDQHEKGYAFEDEVFAEFVYAKKINIHISHWKFFKNINIKCNGQKEQIDLILFTGKEIYIVEAKCFIPGYEPREVVRYMASMGKASEQACRKAKNIEISRAGLKDFLASKNEIVSIDLDKCRVFPLVIVHHPLGAGFGSSNCPIVDVTTIAKFFGNQEPEMIVKDGKETKTIGSTKALYKSCSEADELFPDYLRAPPIIERYKKQLVCREIPLMNADGSPSGLILDYFDIAPDQAEVDIFKIIDSEGT